MFEAILQAFDDGESDELWQFRDVRFDLDPAFNYLPWESVNNVVQPVEDIKGNPGQKGVLIVSSIRMIWYMYGNKDSNLSIGYDCITRAEKKVHFMANSVPKYFLHLKAVKGTSRYEFQFASLLEDAHSAFDLILKYFRLAGETAMYRKVQLRGSFTNKNGEPTMMTYEETKSKYQNVKYFVAASNSVGTLYVTNIRLIWLCKQSALNFSIPWVCIRTIKIRQNFDMDTIVIQAKDRLGSLSFILYAKQLNQIQLETSRLLETYQLKPQMGYDMSMLKQEQSITKAKQFDQTMDFIQPTINVVRRPNRATYQVGSNSITDPFEQIDYNEQLGLAIQRLPQGLTINNLWQTLRM